MKLLLHVCCAPCLEYPGRVLKENKIDFTPYFYNPNIQPYWEYSRRKTAVEDYSQIYDMDIIFSAPSKSEVKEYIMNQETIWKDMSDEKRCEFCYRTRLENSAKYAKENGFEYFSTTLLLSIYQNHELIKKIASESAEKYSVKFYYRDFRDGFRESQKMARNNLLYRQKHCGCIMSLDKSALKDKIIASAPREWKYI